MSGNCLPARRVIVQGPVCTVEECSCGILHVSLGVLTIRLQTEVVASIWETLGQALHRLSAHGHTVPPPPAPRPTRSERPS